jgi:hypothetical protein
MKVVLLQNGNKSAFIPLTYAVHMEATYENLHVLQQNVCCDEYRRNICADLNVVTVLTVLQGG